MKRWVIGSITLVATVAGVGSHFARRHAATHVVSSVTARVAAAKTALAFQGGGFAALPSKNTFIASPPKGSRGDALSVNAPVQASGVFELGRNRPWRPTRVSLPNASPVSGHVEAGVVAYPSVYPDIDVVTSGDAEHVEFGYVVHDTSTHAVLRLHFAEDAGTLALERDRAVVKGPDGQTRLAVANPVAFDAREQARAGTYRIEGNDLVLKLDLAGMVAPVFVDPVFFIPVWSIIDDPRQPGSEVYDAPTISRETQVVYDASRQVPVLVRPSREHQSFGSSFFTVADPLRVQGSSAPSPGEAAIEEWKRISSSQSEVWERRDGRWQLQPDTTFPGLVDAAVAFDPTRGRIVAYGGGVADTTCLFTPSLNQTCILDSKWPWDATYERIGTQWVAQRIPGSPAPRMRGALSPFGSRMILFGGRALAFNTDVSVSGGTSVPGPQSGPLLNDTWSYDGTAWTQLKTSFAPPPADSVQLVQDTRRGVLVLVGGNTGSRFDTSLGNLAGDDFSLWEFDGTAWIQRFAVNDPALPPELRERRGVAALWHPGRQTVLFFGGYVDKMPACPLTTKQVLDDISLASNRPYLEANQCIPGYVQDFWEWDGTSLHQLTRAAFAGYGGALDKFGIYRAIGDTVPGPLSTAGGSVSAVSTLWPWRYDQRADHFQLRSTLERAYVTPGAAGLVPPTEPGTTSALPGAAPPSPTFVSPTFYPVVRPQLFFDPALGKITVIASPGGQVYQTDVTSWDPVPAPLTPFDTGANDFAASAWDSFANRLLLFDPRDGKTWQHRAAGWSQLALTSDLPAATGTVLRNLDDASSGRIWPAMVFDRGRHAAILLHNDKLFELTEMTWQPRTLPSTMTNCSASRAMAYDGARHRTVVVGCRVPGQTWEWDGSQWFGPFPSPYLATARRDFSAYLPGLGLQSYTGTVQAGFAHQNSLAELPSLGGVGLVDWDGTLRLWNGVAWSAGPKIPEGALTDEAKDIIANANYSPGASGLVTNYRVPVALNPPLIEDSVWHRVLTFRGEATGTEEIDLSAPPAARAWARTIIGRPSLSPPVPAVPAPETLLAPPGQWYANPWPLEIWSFERFQEPTQFDPATAVLDNGQPYTQGVTKDVITLAWPFRLFSDTAKKRTLLLSHRGTLWQLGGESVVGIGDACTTFADCGAGVSCVRGKCSAGNYGDVCDHDYDCASTGHGTGGCIDHICCDSRACLLACTTCNGSNPGHCESLPGGTPDPKNHQDSHDPICDGSGCNGVCPAAHPLSADDWQGNAQHFVPITCDFPPGPRPCGTGPTCVGGQFTPQGFCANDACPPPPAPTTCASGLGCADAMSCKTSCTSSTDCSAPFTTCSTDSHVCVPDPVAQLASDLSVPRLNWEAPRRRTPEELRTILRQAGLHETDGGAFITPAPPMGGIELAYDPDLKSPIMGLRGCLERIEACIGEDNDTDQCVAIMPRCTTATPWLDDPAGADCCPMQCLLNYLNRRRTGNERQALHQFFDSGCYPGLDDSADAGAP